MRDLRSGLGVCALLGSALAVLTFVAMSVAYLPYVDVTNHLARYVLMERYWFGPRPDFVEVSLRPTNYIGLDVVGVALVHVFPVGVAARVLALAVLFAPAAGMYALLRAVCPERRGWALVGLLLAFNKSFFMGFLNYEIGVGLALGWLAGYWRVKERPTAGSLAALGVAGVVLPLVHMSAVVIICVVVACDWLVSARDRVRSAARAAAALGPALVLFLLITSASLGSAGKTTFRSPVLKLTQLLWPFTTLSRALEFVMLGGYLASLLVFLVANRRSLRFDGLALATLAFLGLYFAFPLTMGGTADLDVRFLLPALILPFCVSGRAGEVPASAPKWVLAVPFAACLAYGAAVYVETHRVDRDLKDYSAALARLPAGAKILPIVVEAPRFRVAVFDHFAHWYGIRSGVRVPGLFAEPTTAFFPHFRVKPPQLYEPKLTWVVENGVVHCSMGPLDGDRLARDYDYVIYVGGDADDLRRIGRLARFEGRYGRVNVFRVTGRVG